MLSSSGPFPYGSSVLRCPCPASAPPENPGLLPRDCVPVTNHSTLNCHQHRVSHLQDCGPLQDTAWCALALSSAFASCLPAPPQPWGYLGRRGVAFSLTHGEGRGQGGVGIMPAWALVAASEEVGDDAGRPGPCGPWD